MQSQRQPVAYLVLTNGSADEWHGVIDQQHKVIGRSTRCDIVVPARFHHVSRRHAEIHMDRDGIRMRDLNSRCGTHVNGVWIEAQQDAELVIGDRIWLGGVDLNVVSKLPRFVSPVSDTDSSDDGANAGGGTMPIPAQLLLAELTQAELAIVMWISRGYFRDEDIAKKLFRSPNTVRTQMNSIFRKLNVQSRTDIIALLKSVE
jgi:DNA-binding CsgD family transcriptional regulator